MGNTKGPHPLTIADAGLKALTWNLQVSIGFLNLQTLSEVLPQPRFFARMHILTVSYVAGALGPE